jgi:hypothetical protein
LRFVNIVQGLHLQHQLFHDPCAASGDATKMILN